MHIENEYRVRPVVRFNLTHYHADGRSAGVRSLGEFDSLAPAEEVGRAMHAQAPGSTFVTLHGSYPASYPPIAPPDEFVIVAIHTFDVNTKAYFAESREQADQIKATAEKEHGTEFRVFCRWRS